MRTGNRLCIRASHRGSFERLLCCVVMERVDGDFNRFDLLGVRLAIYSCLNTFFCNHRHTKHQHHTYTTSDVRLGSHDHNDLVSEEALTPDLFVL